MNRAFLLPLIVAASTSCATGAPTADIAGGDNAMPAAIGAFERETAPFTVQDEHGRAYGFPFLGGFDVPRPQFVDIDGDGDLDVFVQERSHELMFFENTGAATAPRLEFRSDRYHDLAIGEWFRFVDMDADGDFDLLAELPYSYVKLYRNIGTKQRAQFQLLPDTLRDTAGKPIFADRQNIANAADIDCNRLVDLFLGRVDGTITRYEIVPSTEATPRFRFITDRFEGIEIIGQMSGSMHGANSMSFADHDSDGDLDLFWGDFFEPGVLLIRNQGTCAAPSFRSRPEPLRTAAGDTILSSGYNVPVLADFDGDGDADLFMGIVGGAFNPNRTAADNLRMYERTSSGFVLRSARFLDGIDIGSESVPALGDIDGDGDIDLVVGNKIDPMTLRAARLYIFRNDGDVRTPRLTLSDTIDIANVYHYAPALGDLNGDGRIDMLLGTWNRDVLIVLNDGTAQQPRWLADSTRALRLSRGSNTTPALIDIDDDGDLDVFVGEAAGTINFFRNIGSPRAPRFAAAIEDYDGIDVGRRSHPAFADLDGDGDYDMIIGREEGGATVYRNDGTRTTPRFVLDTARAATIPLPPLAAPIFRDLDGDGRVELITGNLSGGLFLFRQR